MANTVFDRAALLASLEPPRFKDGSREVVGRVLSAPEWWRFESQLEAAGALDGPGVVRLIRELTDEIFPPPNWWQRLRGARSVADQLLGLPLPLQLEAFRSFVVALAKIHRTNPGQPTSSPTTSGSDSPG